MTTIKCKILEFCSGLYSTLVVENLKNNEYLILTIFPNWIGTIPAVGEVGYIEYEFVVGGVDLYYDKEIDSQVKYSNTYYIFRKYVKETHIEENKITI